MYLQIGVAKQKKKAATVTEKDQGNYIDSSRNTAVNLDSKELSKTLKKIKNEDGEIDNSGIVNSDMYQREAHHYATKGLHVASSKNLSIGMNNFQSQKMIIDSSAAHVLDPGNMDILASLAQSLLMCGRHQESLDCAEVVLRHDPCCSKALIAKAEALYNICDFEHRC